MMTNSRVQSRTSARRRALRRRLIPLVESIEQRTLLSTGIGFLQGYAYIDNNADSHFNSGDTASAGVTMQLFSSDGKTLLQSTKTDATGYYQFSGMAPGSYRLVELDPQKLATGMQASMTVDTATQVAANTAAITIADPSQALTWLSFLGSSVLFGALHGRWLAGTIAGMLYAAALYRRGSVSEAVLAHATTNGLIALAVLLGGLWSFWV